MEEKGDFSIEYLTKESNCYSIRLNYLSVIGGFSLVHQKFDEIKYEWRESTSWKKRESWPVFCIAIVCSPLCSRALYQYPRS